MDKASKLFTRSLSQIHNVRYSDTASLRAAICLEKRVLQSNANPKMSWDAVLNEKQKSELTLFEPCLLIVFMSTRCILLCTVMYFRKWWTLLLIVKNWVIWWCPFHTQSCYTWYQWICLPVEWTCSDTRLTVFCCSGPNLFEKCCWHQIPNNLIFKILCTECMQIRFSKSSYSVWWNIISINCFMVI